MHLELINSKSKDSKLSKNLFLNCPYNFTNKNLNVFNCKNCENQDCIDACKNKAISLSESNGIVSIDHTKCSGCGKCIKICKNRAIIIKKKKAYKCDLCLNNSFKMPCYYNNKELLKLISSAENIDNDKIINKYLGFTIENNFKLIKKISNTSNVFLDSTNTKRYVLTLPKLSLEEIEIVNEILDSYKLKSVENKNLEKSLEVKEDLENELIDYCFKNDLELDKEQFSYILESTFNYLYNFGPLTNLLNDEALEEIALIGINKVVYVYHRSYGWLITNLIYNNKNTVIDLINKLSWHSNNFISLKNPILDTYLENGSRLNAIIDPITESVCLTIRKFTKEKITINDLIKFNTIDNEIAGFLNLVFLTDSNIFIAGNTGSGKTTTLNALLEFIPQNERIVLIEQVKEIDITHAHQISTIANLDLGIDFSTLIFTSLRMRPDRVVIGEVRNKEESKAIIDSMLCGQAKGTYTTFHSDSANDTLLRLKSYGVMECDLSSIDLIVIQRRYNRYNFEEDLIDNNTKSDIRKIFEISEVIYENDCAKLNCLYSYDVLKDKFVRLNAPKRLLSKFKIAFGIKNLDEYNVLLKESTRKIEKQFF
ncbi:MAG: ATPase, T2SS/T4P/T4SS family [archaeon]